MGIDFSKINPTLFTIEDNSFDLNNEIKRKNNFFKRKKL